MPDNPLTIFFPGKLVFGNGTLPQLANDIVTLHPDKVLLLTIDPLLHSLMPLKVVWKMQVSKCIRIPPSLPNPSFSDFEKLMNIVTPFDPDIVVGIGGGSVLDVAKLVAAQLGNEQQLKDYVGIGLLKGRKKKLICVPATSGTGSEVSPNAILIDGENRRDHQIILGTRYRICRSPAHPEFAGFHLLQQPVWMH